MMRIRTRIGPVEIAIIGSGSVVKRLSEELYIPESGTSTEKADLTIELINDTDPFEYEPEFYAAKKNVTFNKRGFFVGTSRFVDYVVKDLFTTEGGSHILLRVKRNAGLSYSRRLFRSLSDPVYSSNNYISELWILNYSLFWYVFHIVLLRKRCSFIHASALEADGNGIVFTGTGGCGKTSTTLKLMEEEKYRYLAEDFGIVGSGGELYYNPKFVTLYSSDLRHGQRIGEGYIHDRMPSKTRFIWNISTNLLKHNPRVKVSPSEIFGGDRLSAAATVRTVVYFVRSRTSKTEIADLSLDELVSRAAAASFRELKAFTEILRLINANMPPDFPFPTEHDLLLKTEDVYRKAFCHAQLKLVSVPFQAVPADVVRFLQNNKVV